MIIRISLDAYGDEFSPKILLGELDEPFYVFYSHEPTDYKNVKRSEQYGFGLVSILSPSKIGVSYELKSYEEWYVSFIENNYEKFKRSKVDEINLFIEAFYSEQCNFEIFDKKLLKRLCNYDISLPISVYNVQPQQLLDLLNDAGFSNDVIGHIVKE